MQGLAANQLSTVPNPTSWRIILPYRLVRDEEDNESVFLGTANSDGSSTDNVHNHLLGRR
jgi:hypothetical protein